MIFIPEIVFPPLPVFMLFILKLNVPVSLTSVIVIVLRASTIIPLFSELRSSVTLFGLVGWLHIDIYCKHEENYRNLIFLDNLFKSSYLV